jgi:hypothetical protein
MAWFADPSSIQLMVDAIFPQFSLREKKITASNRLMEVSRNPLPDPEAGAYDQEPIQIPIPVIPLLHPGLGDRRKPELSVIDGKTGAGGSKTGVPRVER